MGSVTSITGMGDVTTSITGMGDITTCMELVSHNERRQLMSLERKPFFSMSLSILLFTSTRLKFNLARVI